MRSSSVPLRRFVRPVRDWLECHRWDQDDKGRSPPALFKRALVRECGRRFGLRVFVETGTFMGDMVRATSSSFDRVISIEIDECLAARARKRFKSHGHVTILNGDSSVILRDVLNSLHEPALFWLDAHYSGPRTARGDASTPVLEELRAILSHQVEEHVVLLDDARHFTGQNDYPTIDTIRELVATARPSFAVTVETDVIRVFDPRGE